MSAATATPAKKEEKTGLLATVANNARQYGIVGALLVIVVAFEVLTGGVLLKPNSFVSLIQQNAYVIILAIGMVMVIIAPTSTRPSTPCSPISLSSAAIVSAGRTAPSWAASPASTGCL